MFIYDCWCTVGLPVIAPGKRPVTEAELLTEMDYCGISQALIAHRAAYESDPAIGNNLTFELCRDQSRFKPLYVLLPDAVPGALSAEESLVLMKENKCFAAVLSPDKQCYSPAVWNMGTYYEAFSKQSIPVFGQVDLLGWDTIDTVCSQFPGLKLVLTGLNYRMDRNLFSLMRKHKNIYLCSCRYIPVNAIERIVEQFGAERVLFGSNMPEYSAGPEITHVMYADISDTDKEKILGLNLKNLLKEI